jgi:hypothetical protein
MFFCFFVRDNICLMMVNTEWIIYIELYQSNRTENKVIRFDYFRLSINYLLSRTIFRIFYKKLYFFYLKFVLYSKNNNLYNKFLADLYKCDNAKDKRHES